MTRTAHQLRHATIRLILLAVIGAVGVSLLAPSRASAQSVMEGPPPAPFYHADPQQLRDAAPGEIVNTRNVFMHAFNEWPVTEIAYRSTNSRDEPILATATVIRPHHAVPNAPVLSYQHYLNALGQNCAPSETLVNPTLETAQDNAMVFLRLQLRKGWTIVIPDHLGPNAAYPGGELSGRITLDGMRAVRDDPRFDSAHSSFGALGYSGGGIATAWAAALHADYAPDVNLVGAAQGGVPTDLTTMATFLGNQPHPAFGLAFAAAVGMSREYPEIRLEEKLTPAGWDLYRGVRGGCTARLIMFGAFKSVPEVLIGGNIFAEHELMAALARNSISNAPHIPDVPIYMWHSGTDPLVPFWDAQALARRYCAAGVPLTWAPGIAPEHLIGAVEKLPAAMYWLEDRFRNHPAPRHCVS